ncbi:uncharacterized protein BDR25DRAFT_304490 [Lindgomyces ingoldianus]|uniref:Uncharacterized protein n=1 Tax=Lindgomyces ingoldianus TaxID=673940 RepID=A0ACB6QR91_9PLEO|nr:uncharacterized protein BDR25DRAFT_304490 [Lindgomyces ingoldianus]KAF2469382.1 hypothetical protein BDR25DRAFT_304490 [Lindgomyces ingoldianus]
MDPSKLPPEVLANQPAFPPPLGVKPNFDNPSDTLADPLTIVNGVFVGLAFAIVAMRLTTRKFICRQGLAWDDTLCAVSMLGSIAHTTLCLSSINIGYGRHFWDIRAISLTEAKIKRLSAIDIIYGIVMYFIKMSLLLLYYRLFQVYSSSRKLVLGGIFMCTLISLPYVGVAISRVVICSSFKVNLEHLTYCYTKPVNTAVATFGAANVISDFYILTIPIARVRSLSIDSRAKMGLAAIFTVGLTACLMSIVRLIYVGVNFNKSDPFYRGAATSIFSAVEMNLAIICSCSTAFPSFYRRGKEVMSPLLRSFSRRTGSNGSRTKQENLGHFELNVHGMLDDDSVMKGSLEPIVQPIGTPHTPEKPPRILTLNMTRATIDVEK